MAVKRSVVVGTAGHIDHGKSALVHAVTGTDPDRLKEEKARGITIDLGFAHTEVEGINLAFVDVPGHERFVKNMLAGVGGIDVVVLVIAADESVMPQTREHFEICRLLRVPAGLVVLSKTDLVDHETLELVRLEARDLIAGSFLDRAPIIPVSARSGVGLDELKRALVHLGGATTDRRAAAAARLPIDRVFSMKGFGTVVTGTLAGGRVEADRELTVLPGGRSVKVRGLQVHGERRTEAVAGERVAVNLGGLEITDVRRGQNLVTPGAFAETRVADATVEVLGDARPLRHGARVRFHQGTVEAIGRVSIIGPVADPISPGGRGFVRLRLETPVVLARGDRYILRAYSPPTTVAGGAILDPVPPRSRVRADSAIARMRALDIDASHIDSPAATRRAAAALVAEAGPAALPVAALVWRVGVDPGEVDVRIRELIAADAAILTADVLVAPIVLRTLTAALVDALTAHHGNNPLSEGMPREELRAQLFRRGHAAVFDRAVEDLAAAGRIVLRDRVALATHRVALTPEEERARTAIEDMFRRAGLVPPDVAVLATELGFPSSTVDRVLKLLQRQRVLVRVESLVFHEEALRELKSEIASMKASDSVAKIDVSGFKERFGVTRKFAIPLLEYLDRERVTRRAGDSRILL
jgi:selenocysteine-specific elongation factor